MKTKTLNLLLIAILVNLTSCKKDWLDSKPSQDLTVPTTLNDFQALLDNQNDINVGSPVLQELASDGHYITESFYQSTSQDYVRNSFTWSHNMPYLNIADWIYPYKRIFECNIVLDGLKKIQVGSAADQQVFNNVKGQALFIRSLSFFQVAQVWAPIYDSAHLNTYLGIPLRLTSDINKVTTRSTLKDTYDQIIKDLVEANALLPITALYKTRACKPAAEGLLAKVYLSIENYTKAGEYANNCLQINNNLLNFNSTADVNPTGSFPMRQFNKEVLFHCIMNNPSAITTQTFIDQSLYSQYSLNDLRRTLFFKVNADGTKNFKGSYAESSAPFAGIAIDEIYLIAAECKARQGDVSSAMTTLNALLATRWATGFFQPYTAVDANDALRQILQERQKELLLRGIRWSDLRRLNRESRFAMTLTRTIGTTTYTLEPNSYRYTFPIPDDIIQMTGIQQNINW